MNLFKRVRLGLPNRKQEDLGLRKGFSLGEKFPWKGIYFEIESVDFDRITIKPIGLTWQKYKQIHNTGPQESELRKEKVYA